MKRKKYIGYESQENRSKRERTTSKLPGAMLVSCHEKNLQFHEFSSVEKQLNAPSLLGSGERFKKLENYSDRIHLINI